MNSVSQNNSKRTSYEPAVVTMKINRTLMKIHLKSKPAMSLILGCAVVALAGSSLAADKLRVGGAVYGLKAEFANLWAAALKKHPAVKDGTVEVTIFDGRYDPMVQNNQIATMMTQKFDGIVLSPVDYNGSAPQIKKAAKAGIPGGGVQRARQQP